MTEKVRLTSIPYKVDNVHPSVVTEDILDGIRDIEVEKSFNSNWERIEMYHLIGQEVDHNIETLKKDTNIKDEAELCYYIAKRRKKSPNTIWYALQFYRMFPDLDKAPFAKDTTWPRIVKEYLEALPKRLPSDYLVVTASPADMERALHKGRKEYKYNSILLEVDPKDNKVVRIALIFSIHSLKEELPKANLVVTNDEDFKKTYRALVPPGTVVIDL